MREKTRKTKKEELLALFCNLIAIKPAFILVNNASYLVSGYSHKNENCLRYGKLTKITWLCDINKFYLSKTR